MTPCPYLFVPAYRPERFAKALASDADAVIVDLKDAVASDAKAAARAALAQWWAGATGVQRLVFGSNDFQLDPDIPAAVLVTAAG